MLTDFQHSFTAALSKKSAIKLLSYFPPHLKRATVLKPTASKQYSDGIPWHEPGTTSCLPFVQTLHFCPVTPDRQIHRPVICSQSSRTEPIRLQPHAVTDTNSSLHIIPLIFRVHWYSRPTIGIRGLAYPVFSIGGVTTVLRIWKSVVIYMWINSVTLYC